MPPGRDAPAPAPARTAVASASACRTGPSSSAGRPPPLEGPGGSAAAGFGHVPFHLASGIALGDVTAAIVDLFASTKAELELGPAALADVEAQRDERQALGSGLAEELIDLWIDYKMSREVNPMRMRPHPFEFHLYYDI